MRSSEKTPILTCLLEGPTGTGKTALAATIGIDSLFPFVKLISAENMVGYSETAKSAQIAKVFDDAYRVSLSRPAPFAAPFALCTLYCTLWPLPFADPLPFAAPFSPFTPCPVPFAAPFAFCCTLCPLPFACPNLWSVVPVTPFEVLLMWHHCLGQNTLGFSTPLLRSRTRHSGVVPSQLTSGDAIIKHCLGTGSRGGNSQISSYKQLIVLPSAFKPQGRQLRS